VRAPDARRARRAQVRLVGGWREVGAHMREQRLQPSLLFYERAERA